VTPNNDLLTKREENKLLVFERKMLRTICGLKQENDLGRRRYNYELGREFDNPCFINVVKTKRLGFAGHMIRRPEDLPQKDIVTARRQATRWQE
jgi:hypothetical protein